MGAVATREKVLHAFELKEKGLSNHKIKLAIGAGGGTVKRWLTNPKLNPYLDGVAIERAVAGDVAVYNELTYYELDEVHRLLSEELRSGLKFGFNQYSEDPLWSRFGSDADRIMKAAGKYREKMALRAKRAS